MPLQGLALPLEVWERDVLPRRTGAYSPAWLDQLCASGEVVWVGAGALGRRSGRVALYFRDDAPLIGPPPKRRRAARGAGPRGGPRAAARRPVLLHRPADRRRRLHDRGAAERAVGPRVGRRGDQRRVRAAALAEAHRHAVVVAASARRAPAHVRLAPPQRRAARGPGPLVADRRAVPHRDRRSGRPPPHAGRAAARALRDRHPRAGAGRGHPGRLLVASTTRWPRWRRSASPAAATSSRASAARSSRCPAPSSGCARRRTTTPRRRSCSPRPTPRSRTAPC